MARSSSHRDNPLPVAPTTLPEFQRLFPDEDHCRVYLARVRWPDGFRCPKCGSPKGWWLSTRPVIECENGHQTYLTAGTAMHRSKLPFCTWFYGAFFVATLTPSISALQFQKQLGISRYETAFNMLHKLRSALVAPDRERLKGEVEIDEAYVGGAEEGRPGRGTERKALVVVAVEVLRYVARDPSQPGDPDAGIAKKRAGRIRMSVIPDASAEALLPWTHANVQPGTIVWTDGWPSYGGLRGMGYDHRPVLQSHEGKKTGHYLPLVHLIVSNLKRTMLGTYKGAVHRKHLQAYLNEYVFRFNRRFWRGPAFLRALGLMVQAEERPEYETLYTAGEEGGWEHPR